VYVIPLLSLSFKLLLKSLFSGRFLLAKVLNRDEMFTCPSGVVPILQVNSELCQKW